MKCITLLLVLVISIPCSIAQVHFYNGSWQEVLAEAQKQNKIIMIDFYTTWCGPCKLMTKTTFANTTIGDFVNANFIAFKVNCEKGEGVKLAEKYEVFSYPTIAFVDKSGNLLGKEIGYKNAEEFMEIIQKYRRKIYKVSFF